MRGSKQEESGERENMRREGGKGRNEGDRGEKGTSTKKTENLPVK